MTSIQLPSPLQGPPGPPGPQGPATGAISIIQGCVASGPAINNPTGGQILTLNTVVAGDSIYLGNNGLIIPGGGDGIYLANLDIRVLASSTVANGAKLVDVAGANWGYEVTILFGTSGSWSQYLNGSWIIPAKVGQQYRVAATNVSNTIQVMRFSMIKLANSIQGLNP